ncbi:hypothetical protein GH714_000202 [Hevea brasiliensis]|uniref:Golgi SNAP receptor complex member 1 n=1 Tax=Hevea brasiliensis TaxID=3981 RepID=A0A6A6N848_HEVBR|nr:hypothetical protein GH714_000202 [Hevea brasiliensis]
MPPALSSDFLGIHDHVGPSRRESSTISIKLGNFVLLEWGFLGQEDTSRRIIRLDHMNSGPPPRSQVVHSCFHLLLEHASRYWARKLEAQLDEQMNSYRKLVSAKASTKLMLLRMILIWDRPTTKATPTSEFTDASLGVIWIRNGFSHLDSPSRNSSRSYSVQEFHRLRSSLIAKQEHASLLEDFREFDRTRLDLEDGVGSTEQALLREHASISRSTGQMDNVISQAQATLGALVLQRSTFGGINSKLSNVTSRLPTVNHILTAIRRKKSMDTITFPSCISVHFSDVHLLADQNIQILDRDGNDFRKDKKLASRAVSVMLFLMLKLLWNTVYQEHLGITPKLILQEQKKVIVLLSSSIIGCLHLIGCINLVLEMPFENSNNEL